jgi:hypothetical protein
MWNAKGFVYSVVPYNILSSVEQPNRIKPEWQRTEIGISGFKISIETLRGIELLQWRGRGNSASARGDAAWHPLQRGARRWDAGRDVTTAHPAAREARGRKR